MAVVRLPGSEPLCCRRLALSTPLFAVASSCSAGSACSACEASTSSAGAPVLTPASMLSWLASSSAPSAADAPPVSGAGRRNRPELCVVAAMLPPSNSLGIAEADIAAMSGLTSFRRSPKSLATVVLKLSMVLSTSACTMSKTALSIEGGKLSCVAGSRGSSPGGGFEGVDCEREPGRLSDRPGRRGGDTTWYFSSHMCATRALTKSVSRWVSRTALFICDCDFSNIATCTFSISSISARCCANRVSKSSIETTASALCSKSSPANVLAVSSVTE
mmetsp:Transcript_54358/g.100387  ORF Transcript_54358/g.100387 Transcript_54358/m.100387 type:complete len:275 (-) Transcript_54358:1178-2002(-)